MRLVADANVLLSAVIGGKAKLVFEHPLVEAVFTAEPVYAEVEEYAGYLAKKKRIDLETVLLAVASLPVALVSPEAYRASMARARRMIGKRDPDDVDLLALALHMKLPLWSNDKDFDGTGVERYTTAELLKKLFPTN